MSDLYSIVPGLQPTAQELLEGELLCKQILEAKFPDLDLREGTALRDLVIRPSATLLAMAKKGIDLYFSQNTLEGIDDTTSTDVLDSILSNWFLTRNIGIKSVISARLYFARKKNVSVTSDIYFSTDNTLKFFPTASSSFSADSMSFDSYNNEYYVDIDLLAEKEGTDYNISSGSLLYFSNFDPYFLRAEINYLKTESINSETNSEFIARSKTAISTRNLINVPSIDSKLRADFNYITKLLTVGAGDPEMIRDIIKVYIDSKPTRVPDNMTYSGGTVTVTLQGHGYSTGQTISATSAVPSGYNGNYVITVLNDNTFTYHVLSFPGSIIQFPNIVDVNIPVPIHDGGMVDIYCSEKLASSIVQLKTDSIGRVELTGPIYAFERSDVAVGDNSDDIPMNAPYSVSNPYLETNQLDQISSAGTEVTVTLSNHGYVKGRYVSIYNCSDTTYNGTWFIKDVVSSSQFLFDLPTPHTATITSNVGQITSVTPRNDYGFSQDQVLVADFGINYGNKFVTFEINYFQNLDSIQNYLNDSTNRVLCADYLARGFNFYLISVEVTSYNSTIPDVTIVETVIKDYLKGLSLGDMFIMSDMVSKLRLNGITNIQSPPKVTYKKYTRDLTGVETGTITDILDPNDRTNTFILEIVTTKAQNIDVTNVPVTI